MPERKMEWINDRFNILGFTLEECSGKGTDFFYANRDDYVAIGEMLAKAIAEGTDVIHTEADLKRKNGEIFPSETTLTLYKVDNDVVSMTGILRDVTLRKKADQQLLEYQQRLKTLASQLTVVEEKERRRIAVDLHDNVCQSLALARMQVVAVRKKVLESTLAAKLDDVSGTLQQTLQDTRHLMSDLSSPSMHEIGLSAAISEWLEETITKQYNLKTEFTDDIDDQRRNSLTDDVRTLLFRNVRELVTNVVKHARAKKVGVRMHAEDNRVKIIIKDDGIGFDPETAAPENGKDSGYGLFSVEERMSNMGGTFEIISGPDKGCEAVLTIPV
jgi:PAS domain S-box-containing protein